MGRIWGDRRSLLAAATLATTLLAAAFTATAGAAPVGTVVHQSAAGVLPPAELPSALSSTMPPTAAWILVDADTGEVVESQNDRTPLPPASLTKVITALAASNVAPSTPVTVSAQAAGEPLDDLGVHTGQVWSADDLFHAMLIYSANDAAMALAQQVAGSTASIQTVLSQTAQALGLQDHPLLYDPAGLDGSEGVAGGNRVSARDLAIAGRALLADPYLASIVALQTYNFRSPTGGQVRLVSHNLAFLSSYRGSIGIKTGYTNLAGTCVMAAARRDGRTMLAVVLHSANPTVAATTLLDDGFNTPVASEPTADQLPTVDLTALQPTAAIGVSAGGSSAETPAVAAPAGASPAAAAGPAIAGAGIAAAGAHQPKSFGMLTLDGILALLLCLATLVRTRPGRRRTLAPNLRQVDRSSHPTGQSDIETGDWCGAEFPPAGGESWAGVDLGPGVNPSPDAGRLAPADGADATVVVPRGTVAPEDPFLRWPGSRQGEWVEFPEDPHPPFLD